MTTYFPPIIHTYVHPWLKPHQHNFYSAKSQKDSYQKIELFFLSPTVELLSPLLGFYMLFHWTRLLCRLLITFTMAWYFKARRGPAMPFIANTQIMVWNKLNLINSQIRPQVKNTGYLLGNIPLLWHDLLHFNFFLQDFYIHIHIHSMQPWIRFNKRGLFSRYLSVMQGR